MIKKVAKGVLHTPQAFALQSSGMEGSVIPSPPFPKVLQFPAILLRSLMQERKKGWVTNSKNEQSLNLGSELEI